MKLTVFISVARHPKSGRTMLAPNDARALAVAKRLVQQPNVVHVGPKEHEWTLRQYLGLGIDEIQWIQPHADQDVATLIAGYLMANPCEIAMFGERAQGGEDTGLVPYLVAEANGLPLVDQVLAITDGELTQFQPKGKRRTLALSTPSVITVSSNAPLELEYVARRARNGQLNCISTTGTPVSQTALQWQAEPSQPGHKRLTIKSNKSGWDRFSRRMAVSGGGGEVVRDLDEGVDKVLGLLRSKKLVP